MPKKTDEKIVEKICALLRQGLRHKEIAERCGVSRSLVQQIGKKRGIDSYAARRWTPERLQRAVDLYRSGMSLRAVAAEIGSDPGTVGKRLKKVGAIRDKAEMYRGAGNPAWVGGRGQDGDGYIWVYHPDHPFARKSGRVLEHRLVMEQHLGRYLKRNEVVHHKNGDRSDNRIENLELYASNAAHLRDELTGNTPNWSEEGRQRTIEGHRRWAAERRSGKV